MDASTSILSIQDLHKSFDQTPILKGVSFSIEEGDLVSVIGPSGCGKSTMLRCINGLETLDSGVINAAGACISRMPGAKLDGDFEKNAHTLRQRVGMVFQQFNLFPHRTLLQNTMMAPSIVRGVTREDAERTGRSPHTSRPCQAPVWCQAAIGDKAYGLPFQNTRPEAR
jgi:polar amino acid transport system ATP-binding protein